MALINCMTAMAAPSDIDIAVPDDLDTVLENATPKKYKFSGYIKNETAYRYNEPRSFTKIRNIGLLNFQYIFNSHVKFYTSAWAYYDVVYDLFDYRTIAARDVRDANNPLNFVVQLPEDKDQKREEVREMYFDVYLNNLDMRIGKQYVIWGVIEGIRVVDEINPMDFRELIIPDLLDYRIPLWTFKADYYHKKTAYEFLWIPDLKFNKPAPAGSEWELFQVLPNTTKPESFNLKNSEVGFKITREMLNATFSLSYFYTWDDYPTTFRVINSAQIRANSQDSLAIFPTYMRMQMFGGTMTKEISGNILKAEFAYVKDKYFALVNKFENGYLADDGDVKKDSIRAALGYDFSFWGADISPSVNQTYILNYESAILDNKISTGFNLFIRKPIQKYSAVFTLLAIYLVNYQEQYIKPRVTLNLTDHVQITLGADLFYGKRTSFGRKVDPSTPSGLSDPIQSAQFLGNFRDNKRVDVEFKYNF